MQGYGHDWIHWDKFINTLYPKPTDVKYENWYPFRSPKGIMMAFYNTSYGDIKVINLETKEIVVEEFYSHSDTDPEKNWYKSHTNISTYVPSYWVIKEKKHVKDHPEKDILYTILDYDTDPLTEETLNSYGQFKSLPVAFNAWTIWGIGTEFYVDVLDLREIDSGIIRKWKNIQYIITRDASHVRDFIKHSTDVFDSEDDIICDFKVMEERWKDRLSIKGDEFSFYDMYEVKSKDDAKTKGYTTTDKAQWLVDKDMYTEVKKAKK